MAPLSPILLDYFNGPSKVALLAFLICLALYCVEYFFLRIPYPKGIPLIREPDGARSFSLRTRLAFYTDCQALFRDAYQNYLKKGKPVVLPGLGIRHEVILPQKSMRWVLAQPESTLSLNHAFAEFDQVKYSLGHEKYVVDGWQGELVKKEMNAVLENIVLAMNDELAYAFDSRFGTVTKNWKEIDLLETVRLVVAQAASRFTVGLPMCRNEDYLKTSMEIADGLVLTAGGSGFMPRILRPVVGRLVAWPTTRRVAKVKRIFQPLYRERLELLKLDKDAPSHVEPQDHLQIMFRFASTERKEELLDLDIMTKRLCTANFGSMHQTSIQVTNMLLNILGSDAEYNTINVLRDESRRVLREGSGTDEDKWTKAKVAKLIKADSVARETLRMNSFGGRALFRKVMTDGFKTEEGIHIPKGTMLSFLGQPAQHDEDSFDDPWKYDPFRFSRIREAALDGDAKAPNVSFVTTSPEHLPFGHGRHACPGRFLIDFELKMIISYVLGHYDIEFPPEYNGKRPENRWLAEANFPPAGAKIRIRRRADDSI